MKPTRLRLKPPNDRNNRPEAASSFQVYLADVEGRDAPSPSIIRFAESVGAEVPELARDDLPGVSLARANMLWLFALNRSHGAALAGALAVAESVAACADRDLAAAARRFGWPEMARDLEQTGQTAGLAAQGKANEMAAHHGNADPLGLSTDLHEPVPARDSERARPWRLR